MINGPSLTCHCHQSPEGSTLSAVQSVGWTNVQVIDHWIIIQSRFMVLKVPARSFFPPQPLSILATFYSRHGFAFYRMLSCWSQAAYGQVRLAPLT